MRKGRIPGNQYPLETGLPATFKLVCGHYTTREYQVMHCYARPDSELYLCNICNEWVERVIQAGPSILWHEPQY